MNTPDTAGAAANGILKVPRSIVLTFTVKQNAVQTPANLQIPNDGPFEWWWISAFRTSAAVRLLMTETGVGNRAFIYNASPNSPNAFNGILIDNWAGTVATNGAFPIAVPYTMPANRQYQFLFTDTGAGEDNPLEIALHGYALLPV